MPGPRLPTLTFLLVPILALTSRTREPAGELICPEQAVVVGTNRVRSVVDMTGAQEGARRNEGVVLQSGEYLHLELPRNDGWIQVRIRADHGDSYLLEVPTPEGWAPVGEFGPTEAPGMRNRSMVEVPVSTAGIIALTPQRDGQQSSVSLVCFRGTRWTVPAWIVLGFLMGFLFVLLRSIPHPTAEKLVWAWGRADPVVALLFGIAVLMTPLLLVTIAPAVLVQRAWSKRAAVLGPSERARKCSTSE